MTTSKVSVTEGSGKNVATNSFTEDAVTKEAQRVVFNDSSGNEVGNLSRPIFAQFGGKSVDAFFRARVSHPQTLFDVQNQYNTQPLLFQTLTSGTGASSHLPNESSVQLGTGGVSSGAYCYRQSREYFRYQPGKSQLVLITAVIGALKTNVRQRVGLFDANNGLFFEQDGVNLKVVRRTYTSGSPVDNTVNQSSWNVDKCDGTGASGFNFTASNGNIFFIDFEWLGVGVVRMGFFNEQGVPIICHQFQNANSLTSVYMQTPNLPIQYQIENTGVAASATTMKAICCSVISEGGFEMERGLIFTANNGTTSIGVTTRRAILSIRPAATFNSITNRALIVPMDLEIAAKTNDSLWELVYNPTYTGTPTWTAVDSSNSAVEYSVHGDAAAGAFTGGVVIDSGYAVAGSSTNRVTINSTIISRLPLTLDNAGSNPIGLAIVCTSLNATSTVSADINWREFK